MSKYARENFLSICAILKTFTVSNDYCLLYSVVTWVSASSEEASDLYQLPSTLLFDMGWILRNEIV